MRVKEEWRPTHAGVLLYFAVSGSQGVEIGAHCPVLPVSLARIWVTADFCFRSHMSEGSYPGPAFLPNQLTHCPSRCFHSRSSSMYNFLTHILQTQCTFSYKTVTEAVPSTAQFLLLQMQLRWQELVGSIHLQFGEETLHKLNPQVLGPELKAIKYFSAFQENPFLEFQPVSFQKRPPLHDITPRFPCVPIVLQAFESSPSSPTTGPRTPSPRLTLPHQVYSHITLDFRTCTLLWLQFPHPICRMENGVGGDQEPTFPFSILSLFNFYIFIF